MKAGSTNIFRTNLFANFHCTRSAPPKPYLKYNGTKVRPVKSNEKRKTQGLINKIQSGQFDENDVDGLFMKLRAYSTGFRVFREIADLIAHNDQRNHGLVNQALETVYLRMKFFMEYHSP